MHVIFEVFLWNKQRIFLYLIFLENYFGIFPGISIGIFFRIYWEYLTGMFHEYSTNIYLFNGLPRKDRLYTILPNPANSDKNYERVLNVRKAMK